ncbi:MAG: ATPase [Rikenellaceae bacterium]|nr:ATPase [Rikenellaceae bacterium]
MRVIIESGATKSDWRVVSAAGEEMARFAALGTNVSTMPMSAVEAVVRDVCGQIIEQGIAIDAVYMYTAGVVTAGVRTALMQTFQSIFAGATVEIEDDLTAAARAACGHRAGIVAILGTGSNSCQFDGEKIVKRIYSGGFILGDEGSAATLGKLFIADLLKGMVPKYIADDFASRYQYDYAAIVGNVYHSTTSPSAFLGGLAPFILEYYNDVYIRTLVDDNFRAFIRRSLKQYDVDRYPVGVVGGFGNALKSIFSEIATQEGITLSRFISSPIEELIKYHTI